MRRWPNSPTPVPSSSSPVRDAAVRRILASEAERIRALRLRALSDPLASVAFLETRENAEAHPASFWTERAAAGALSDRGAQFVAEAGDQWVGTATVLAPDAGSVDYFGRAHRAERALLVAVWIDPDWRGRGILPALVDAAAEWARARGRAELALDVHRDNPRARAAYGRLGFTATGETTETPNGVELEMVRGIGAADPSSNLRA